MIYGYNVKDIYIIKSYRTLYKFVELTEIGYYPI
jgi:hypothetical protein